MSRVLLDRFIQFALLPPPAPVPSPPANDTTASAEMTLWRVSKDEIRTDIKTILITTEETENYCFKITPLIGSEAMVGDILGFHFNKCDNEELSIMTILFVS